MKHFWLPLVVVAFSGCLESALRQETRNLGESGAALRYQEILSNLAMIADNPYAIPAHTTIYGGLARIDDSVLANPSMIWSATKSGASSTNFFFQSLDVNGTRTFTDTWTLDAIGNPAKLRAMRAAYRWVLFGEENAGPDAASLYSSHEDKNLYPPWEAMYHFDVADDLARLPRGWVHCKPCSRFIRTSGCYSATFHGIHVWVDEADAHSLSVLTLVIQKIVRADSTVADPGPKVSAVTVMNPAGCTPNCPGQSCSFAPIAPEPLAVTKLTANVDSSGRPAPDLQTTPIPLKRYTETFGQDTTLRSAIAAASKSP